MTKRKRCKPRRRYDMIVDMYMIRRGASGYHFMTDAEIADVYLSMCKCVL